MRELDEFGKRNRWACCTDSRLRTIGVCHRSGVNYMQCAAMNINSGTVINEVRAREQLWDITYELYKDRDARLSSWQEVYRQMLPNFRTMTAREQTESGKQ